MAGIACICLAVFGCVYYGVYRVVADTAGQTTTVSVAQDFAAKVDLSVWLAWGATAVMGVGAYKSRKARIQERAEKDKRIAELEKALDPARTSSGLDPAGKMKQGNP